ncbi:hypothetical protein KFE94_18015 [bacterium SCSIO 12643]|nr:hypothetical protein KFE94_18015 [bacterium SCSIO 12643]
MKKILLFGLLAIMVIACTENETSIENFKSLNGQWVRNFNGNQQLENWKIQTDKVIGSSSFVNNGDTTKMTEYEIIEDNGNWILLTQEVGFENATQYPLIFGGTDSLVFHNSAADWPQTISFKTLNGNTLHKSVLGQGSSMKKNIEFTFKKKE